MERQADCRSQERGVHQREAQRHEVEPQHEDAGKREEASGEHEGDEAAEDRWIGERLYNAHEACPANAPASMRSIRQSRP